MGTALDRWNPWSLQYRITASVSIGLGIILVLFGYINFWSIGQATDAALQERQRLAIVLAQHVEAMLTNVPPNDLRAAATGLLMGYAGPPDGRLQVELLDGAGAVVATTPSVRTRPPSRDRVTGTGSSTATNAAGTAAVVTGAGQTLPGPGGHAVLLADLIAAGQSGVRVHHPAGGGNAAAHIVAYAPLRLSDSRGNWGLTVEQPEDTVLSLPRRLRDRMLVIGGVALVTASALAWLDARQVVRPLRRVTVAAQRIAAGDLSVPLADAAAGRRDEVGRLTLALDTMRGRLVRSVDEIKEWNQELERRVQQRTHELAAVSMQHRQLLNKVIWAQEEERKRLARELHDDTLQTLSGVAMALQAVEDELPVQHVRARARLAWARAQAVGAAREIRQLLLDLRPSVLDDLGLVAAVRWYATTHLQPSGVRVRIDAPVAPLSLPPPVQIVAFRVLQEAITNVAKHAHATRVAVRIALVVNRLEAAVQDNGQGFDPAALNTAGTLSGDPLNPAATGAGLGLLGMQERVALLGGRLLVRARPGQGTRVEFSIPFALAGAVETDPVAPVGPSAMLDAASLPVPAVAPF